MSKPSKVRIPIRKIPSGSVIPSNMIWSNSRLSLQKKYENYARLPVTDTNWSACVLQNGTVIRTAWPFLISVWLRLFQILSGKQLPTSWRKSRSPMLSHWIRSKVQDEEIFGLYGISGSTHQFMRSGIDQTCVSFARIFSAYHTNKINQFFIGDFYHLWNRKQNVSVWIQETVSHLGQPPANNESAGKKKSVRISKAGQYLKPLLVQCALSTIKDTTSHFGRKYSNIKKRRGHKKAIIAIACMILVSIYHMILKE